MSYFCRPPLRRVGSATGHGLGVRMGRRVGMKIITSFDQMATNVPDKKLPPEASRMPGLGYCAIVSFALSKSQSCQPSSCDTGNLTILS